MHVFVCTVYSRVPACQRQDGKLRLVCLCVFVCDSVNALPCVCALARARESEVAAARARGADRITISHHTKR